MGALKQDFGTFMSELTEVRKIILTLPQETSAKVQVGLDAMQKHLDQKLSEIALSITTSLVEERTKKETIEDIIRAAAVKDSESTMECEVESVGKRRKNFEFIKKEKKGFSEKKSYTENTEPAAERVVHDLTHMEFDGDSSPTKSKSPKQKLLAQTGPYGEKAIEVFSSSGGKVVGSFHLDVPVLLEVMKLAKWMFSPYLEWRYGIVQLSVIPFQLIK